MPTNPSLDLQQQQEINHSRILFEEVMVDNQPTQQQVEEKAQQLQITDLDLARESLTKELEPFWRPYMNRFGDIYYINLKQKRAYIDHPIDMQAKMLFAKRHRKILPKFRSYDLEDVSSSIHLIEDQIRKFSQLGRTQQQIPSKLNIVYEQSEESHTSRQHSSGSQISLEAEQEYIQNLQHQKPNLPMINIPSSKPQINKHYKKFPIFHSHKEEQNEFQIGEQEGLYGMRQKQKQLHMRKKQEEVKRQRENQKQENQEVIELDPDYEKLLIEYEQELRKANQIKLEQYKEKKRQNYLKKQHLLKQQINFRKQSRKLAILQDFEEQTEQKNHAKHLKDLSKLKLQYQQQLQQYSSKLKSQQQTLIKLQQVYQSKQSFIANLQNILQRRLIQRKHIKTQTVNKQLSNDLSERVARVSSETKKEFDKQLKMVISQNITQKLLQKGVIDSRGTLVYPSSLSALCKDSLKKQLNQIDTLIVQNQLSRQLRKRNISIFSKPSPQYISQRQSHITFVDYQKQNRTDNVPYIKKKQQKENVIKEIQASILKSKDNNRQFIARRNKIFGSRLAQSHLTKGYKQNLIQKQQNEQQKPQFSNINDQNQPKPCLSNGLQPSNTFIQHNSLNIPDRKSMYLRMMKRIL